MDSISKSQVSRLREEIEERVTTFLDQPIEGDWPYPVKPDWLLTLSFDNEFMLAELQPAADRRGEFDDFGLLIDFAQDIGAAAICNALRNGDQPEWPSIAGSDCYFKGMAFAPFVLNGLDSEVRRSARPRPRRPPRSPGPLRQCQICHRRPPPRFVPRRAFSESGRADCRGALAREIG